MTNTIEFLGKIYATDSHPGQPQGVIFLQDLPGPKLVEIHNLALAQAGIEKRVNRFSDHKAAVRRTWEALGSFVEVVKAEQTEPVEPVEQTGETEQVQKPKGKGKGKGKKSLQERVKEVWLDETVPAKKKTTRQRSMRFVFPTTNELRKVKPSTYRATLVDLLLRPEGASFEECLAATWGERADMSVEKQIRTTYEGIRMLHYYVGYGMTQDEDGRIHLRTKTD